MKREGVEGTPGRRGGVFLHGYASLTDDEYRLSYALATKVALALSLNRQQSEDVAQDVTIALWLRVSSPRGQPIRDRAKWVAACARNAALRVLKLQRRELPRSALVPACVEAGKSVDWRIDLVMALDRLPASEQELFRLRHVERMPVSRIAGRMGSSESTVRRRLRLVKAALINALTID